ncbi:hypothetical protein [Streptomyces sp. NPDC059076]|uniref:hypothetical protein n=1 Tax=unclassified Streptomyces TaxID=2593676 RepID=UPI00368B8921
MAEDPSNGELSRLIEALRSDMRDDLGQVNQRLDRKVSTEVYAVEKAAMAQDIADLKKSDEAQAAQRERDGERVTQTRRWLIAAVIIPILGLIVPFAFFIMGGKG